MKESELKRQREYRRNNNNIVTKRYERTKKGKLVRTYRNMMNRVNGLSKPHLYANKGLIDKEKFYKWSLKDNNYNELYDCWVKNNFCKKLSPSIDRIDTNIGYVEGNIRWVTHSENSRNGGKWRKNK